MGYWRTAMGAVSLASFFDELEEWAGSLRNWKPIAELDGASTSIKSGGKLQGLHVGMRALSAAVATISNASTGQREQDVAVLEKLLQLRESEHHDPQLAYLKSAVDAMNDLKDGRHQKGHRKNVALLEKACNNAEEAARIAHGNLATKLQAYQIWIITAFWHEVVTKSCEDAKKEAMYILGHIILGDRDLLEICEKYSRPRACGEQTPRLEVANSGKIGDRLAWQGGALAVEDIAVIEFLLEVVSSVTMLPPLDQDVKSSSIVKVVGAGMKVVANQMELIGGEVILGPGAPPSVVLAMGRYCASNRDIAQAYPNVSALALFAWEQGKERLALDNFFSSTGGGNWNESKGWTDKDGDLSRRFGVTVENGHVSKLNLASNNLQGVLHGDLADCEHLRELVLHGNSIVGGVPPQLERLIKGKPNIIVTGIVLDETPEAPFREDLLLQQAAPRGERCGQQPSLCPRPLPTYSRRGTGTPFDQPLSASQKTSPTSDIPPKSSNGGKRVSVPTSVDSSRTGSFGGGSGYGNLGDLDLMAAVDEAALRTPCYSRASSDKSTDSKNSSLSKRMGKFLKSSIGANFDVGYAQQCQFCGGKLKYAKNQAAVCPTCSEC